MKILFTISILITSISVYGQDSILLIEKDIEQINEGSYSHIELVIAEVKIRLSMRRRLYFRLL